MVAYALAFSRVKAINKIQFLLPFCHLYPSACERAWVQRCCQGEKITITMSAVISAGNSYRNAHIPTRLGDKLEASLQQQSHDFNSPSKTSSKGRLQIKQLCNYAAEGPRQPKSSHTTSPLHYWECQGPCIITPCCESMLEDHTVDVVVECLCELTLTNADSLQRQVTVKQEWDDFTECALEIIVLPTANCSFQPTTTTNSFV